jgi:hypothetical protein
MVFFFNRQRRTELTPREGLKRDLAEIVYNNPNGRPREFLGYSIDNNFNTNEYAVYFNPTEKDMIFVIRGTASAQDIFADLQLIRQQLLNKDQFLSSGRFKRTTQTFLRAYDAYSKKGYTIRLSGHSLSAFEIIKLTQREGDKVDSGIVFNAGSIPIQKDKIPEEITHLRSPNDIVSLGWRSDKQTKAIYRPNTNMLNVYGNHTISYFK